MSSLLLHLDESRSASPEFSPGAVEDREQLLRKIYDSYHTQSGNYLKTAVSLKELRSSAFSTHRKNHTNETMVKIAQTERLDIQRSGQSWREEGLAILNTVDARTIIVDDGQTKNKAFVVIDIATKMSTAHASIYAAHPEMGEAHARELRTLLTPLLKNRKSIDEVLSWISIYTNSGYFYPLIHEPNPAFRLI